MSSETIKGTNPNTILVALEFVAKKFDLDLETHHYEFCLTGFAEAVALDWSIDDMIKALRMRAADMCDCRTWRITPTQWRKEVRMALAVMISRAIEYNHQVARKY